MQAIEHLDDDLIEYKILGRLTESDELAVDCHLAQCAVCKEHYQETEEFIKALKGVYRDDVRAQVLELKTYIQTLQRTLKRAG